MEQFKAEEAIGIPKDVNEISEWLEGLKPSPVESSVGARIGRLQEINRILGRRLLHGEGEKLSPGARGMLESYQKEIERELKELGVVLE